MTFPRELTIHDNHLYMMPVEELSLLREKSKSRSHRLSTSF